jgi:hypothetical protein
VLRQLLVVNQSALRGNVAEEIVHLPAAGLDSEADSVKFVCSVETVVENHSWW